MVIEKITKQFTAVQILPQISSTITTMLGQFAM